MTEFCIKIAEKNISVTATFESTRDFCSEYLCSSDANITVTISKEDIEYEKRHAFSSSEKMLELNALHRNLCNELIDYNTILIHSSAVALDGKGYLFTAPSGTGKSTHTEKWVRLHGAIHINDDKPFIKVEEQISIHGTPWKGKHNLGKNLSVPMQAICVICRGSKNEIKQLSPSDSFSELMKQAYVPKTASGAKKAIAIISHISKNIPVYKLFCNMDDEAAYVALSGMKPQR